jgi:hypothetical protein
MKKVLLSLLLLSTVSTLFSQITQQPGFPCPVDISSNQGGGNCRACTSNISDQLPNVPGGDFSQGTGMIVLDFGANATLNCIPRLLRVIDKDGFVRPVQCGLGNLKQTGNDNMIIEYCLFGDNDFNFFNQPELVAVLSYECAPNAPVIIACNSEGEQVPIPGEETPLPVHFKSFNADRQNANVSISWTTATEQNNKGFNVQRNTGGQWQTVAFVPSQALGGNSVSDINYSYTDVNNEKGISQYRIQQIDINGKFAYTDIRAIRGEDVGGKMVIYPNPSNDGKINIVFDDNKGIRDVQVSDMQGRIIRSFKGVTNNVLVIDRLTSGFYTIRVNNPLTSLSTVQKVAVK